MIVVGTTSGEAADGLEALIPPSGPSPSDLLDAFLELDHDLESLIRKFNLAPRQIRAFIADPEVIAYLKSLRTFQSLSFAVRSLTSRITAINTLERITRETTDPIEQRRAASALVRACASGTALRAVNPPKGRDAGSSDPTTQDSSGPEDSQDSSPAPLYSPSPDLDHVHTIKAAFAPFEEVDKDTALATLHEFLHKDAHVFRSPVPQDPEDFIDDVRHTALAAPFSRVFYSPVCDITGRSKRHHASADAVEYKVTLEHGSRRPIPLTVRLSLSDDGPFSRCWLITSITHAASWPSAP